MKKSAKSFTAVSRDRTLLRKLVVHKARLCLIDQALLVKGLHLHRHGAGGVGLRVRKQLDVEIHHAFFLSPVRLKFDLCTVQHTALQSFPLGAGHGGYVRPYRGGSAGAQAVLTVLSVAFFAPPAYLLYAAKKEKDAHTLKLVRGISLLSLGLTLLALVLNVLSAMGTVTMGNALFGVLIVVSSPMVCSGYWALSLFLWACLLIVSHSLLRKNFN